MMKTIIAPLRGLLLLLWLTVVLGQNGTLPSDSSFVTSIPNPNTNQTMLDAAKTAYTRLLQAQTTGVPNYKFLPIQEGFHVAVAKASAAPGSYYKLTEALFLVQGRNVTCIGAFDVYVSYNSNANSFQIEQWGSQQSCSDSIVQAVSPDKTTSSATMGCFSWLKTGTLVATALLLISSWIVL